jgi:hypothetical protein
VEFALRFCTANWWSERYKVVELALRFCWQRSTSVLPDCRKQKPLLITVLGASQAAAKINDQRLV